MGRGLRSGIIILCMALLLGGCGDLTPPAGPPREQTYYHNAPSVAGTYTVRPGDTLYSIAWGYGLDHREVAAWNNISPPYTIHPGDQLRLSPPLQRDRSSTPSFPSNSASRKPVITANAPKKKISSANITRKSHLSGKPSRKPVSRSSKKEPKEEKKRKTPPVKTTQSVGDNEKLRTSSLPALEKQDLSPTNISWRWPTEGKVVARFDPDSGKKGIDITGLSGQSIFSAAAGDVVYSGSGLLGYGNLIIIKHDDAFLSAYGHNSQLLVKEGDKVAAGQEIAKMGVSPKEGALLHFEIRREGKPVDPSKYLPKKN